LLQDFIGQEGSFVANLNLLITEGSGTIIASFSPWVGGSGASYLK